MQQGFRHFILDPRPGTKYHASESAGPALARIGPGELSGEYGLFRNEARGSPLRAIGPAVVFTLDYQRFHRFLPAYPQASLALLQTVIGPA